MLNLITLKWLDPDGTYVYIHSMKINSSSVWFLFSLSLPLPPQASPTDLRHFDPTLTSIPPTIADLVGTERSLHIEGFDYVAPIANGSNTKLDSTSVESHHRMVAQAQKRGTPGNNEDTLDESHEQHRPISEQIHNGKSTAAGYTFEVTVEVNES